MTVFYFHIYYMWWQSWISPVFIATHDWYWLINISYYHFMAHMGVHTKCTFIFITLWFSSIYYFQNISLFQILIYMKTWPKH